ncbi:MAG: ribulose-phosphate 3-epimerase [Phycisphaeraceae bacterium]
MLDLTAQPPHPLVAASILSADFGAMALDCTDVLSKGADLLHIDVMDGHFVPNLTMGADMIRGLRKHFPDTYLDVHLMVEHPGDYVEAFAKAGANLFSFHLEVTRPAMPLQAALPAAQPARAGLVDAFALIDRIHAAGMHAGMVVNPPTAPHGLEPYLSKLELVLVMSVNPGRSGQAFMPQVLEKTRWAREKGGRRLRVEMDGGLNPQTSKEAVAAGADVLVTASALFGATDRGEVIRLLHEA